MRQRWVNKFDVGPSNFNMKSTSQSLYISYLLRLWQEMSEGEPVWRASLESPLTKERWGFTDITKLLDFLEKRTRDHPSEDLPNK
jgi:hypothetical protein